MHTARQLSDDMFGIEVGGRAATIADLLPNWTCDSRLGVIVREPLGALGASVLIQAATVAFYAANPARREHPLYAEIFLFHVAGAFGSFAPLDIWPPRKEIFIGQPPQDLLAAVNNCAVTHLAAPDASIRPVEHHFKELDAARDRLRGGFLYAASGRTPSADVRIVGVRGAGAADVATVIRPEGLIVAVEASANANPDTAREKRRFANELRRRLTEVDPAERQSVAEGRTRLRRSDGAVVETYRRLSSAEVLGRL